MLIEVLRQAAAKVPDQSIVVSRDRSLSYAECLDRAETLARGLSARSIDRIACLVDDVGELIALLCASSATGTEACVYPDRLDDAGASEFAALFGHDVLATDRRLASSSQPAVVALDDLATEEGEPPALPDRAPVLVLTTGTTGAPKGVRHDWARLVGAVRRSDEQPGARWLLAYNLNQFAGLQMLL